MNSSFIRRIRRVNLKIYTLSCNRELITFSNPTGTTYNREFLIYTYNIDIYDPDKTMIIIDECIADYANKWDACVKNIFPTSINLYISSSGAEYFIVGLQIVEFY